MMMKKKQIESRAWPPAKIKEIAIETKTIAAKSKSKIDRASK
jgi:hypothetical protein